MMPFLLLWRGKNQKNATERKSCENGLILYNKDLDEITEWRVKVISNETMGWRQVQCHSFYQQRQCFCFITFNNKNNQNIF